MNNNTDDLQIFGLSISLRTEREILEDLSTLLHTDRGRSVYTPNAEMLYRALKDIKFRNTLRSASRLIPDGSGIFLASRLMGTPLPQRAAGIDVAWDLLKIAAAEGLSVYLLGGREGVATAAAEKLCIQIRGLQIAGAHHGYFNKETDCAENRAVLSEISQSGADILLVCFGSPAQEIWIEKNLPSLPNIRLAMALGGSLDVWSGESRRAPQFMQKAGLEWLFRLLSEPKRISRLPALFGFCVKVVKTSARIKNYIA